MDVTVNRRSFPANSGHHHRTKRAATSPLRPRGSGRNDAGYHRRTTPDLLPGNGGTGRGPTGTRAKRSAPTMATTAGQAAPSLSFTDSSPLHDASLTGFGTSPRSVPGAGAHTATLGAHGSPSFRGSEGRSTPSGRDGAPTPASGEETAHTRRSSEATLMRDVAESSHTAFRTFGSR